MLTYFRFEVLQTERASHTNEMKTLGRYFIGAANSVREAL